MLAILLKAIEKQEGKEVIIIDSLDRLKKSDIDIFTTLIDKFTILGAADEMPERLKQIWWKMKRIDLEPLSDEATKTLIKRLTDGLVIDNYQLLETQIASRAYGDPLAVVEMINQIKGLPRVREHDIRELHHEAGTKYIEVKNLIVVLWLMAIGYRFIALGTHSFENYILAGFFVTITVGLRMFLRRV
jgi:replication-associated recombination protein RarA